MARYIFDVTFRTEDRDAIKAQLFEMTRKRFEVAKYLAAKKDWNLFMLHEIGFDRLHHAFWKYFDPSHPKYVKGNKYESVAEKVLPARRRGAGSPDRDGGARYPDPRRLRPRFEGDEGCVLREPMAGEGGLPNA